MEIEIDLTKSNRALFQKIKPDGESSFFIFIVLESEGQRGATVEKLVKDIGGSFSPRVQPVGGPAREAFDIDFPRASFVLHLENDKCAKFQFPDPFPVLEG